MMKRKILWQWWLVALAVSVCWLGITKVSIGATHAELIQNHRLVVYLDPELYEGLDRESLEVRMNMYMQIANYFFVRQTIRRLNFNPSTDIHFVTEEPHSNSYRDMPLRGYEVWIHIRKSNRAYSYGGFKGWDISGAGVVQDIYWDKIRDFREVYNDKDQIGKFWSQMHGLLKGLGKVFGAGAFGNGYYMMNQVEDRTGIEPKLDIDLFKNGVNDPYFSTRQEMFGDPLLRSTFKWDAVGAPETFTDLIEKTKFSPLSVAIINHLCRYCANNEFLTDLTQTKVVLREKDSGELLSGKRIRLFKVDAYGHQATLLEDGRTESDGSFHFHWDTVFQSREIMLLVKVEGGYGHKDTQAWFSLFDAQRAKVIEAKEQFVMNLEMEKRELSPEEIRRQIFIKKATQARDRYIERRNRYQEQYAKRVQIARAQYQKQHLVNVQTYRNRLTNAYARYYNSVQRVVERYRKLGSKYLERAKALVMRAYNRYQSRVQRAIAKYRSNATRIVQRYYTKVRRAYFSYKRKTARAYQHYRNRIQRLYDRYIQ